MRGEEMMRSGLIALLLGLLALAASPVSAHIGSPNVFYDGVAGPYQVRVIIKTPPVVPGLAEITVRAPGTDIRRVTVRPVHWRANLKGAPPADEAQPVRGDATLYTAELWLMTSGSYSVYVEVDGERGSGTAIVPVQAVATQRLDMPAWMGGVLIALGVLLVAGLVRLAGAGVESMLTPGEDFGPGPQRRARVVMAVTMVLVSLVLYGGKSWWDEIDLAYRQGMWKTYDFEPSARTEEGFRVIELDLTDDLWQRSTPIAPDHGKLMHMFLIREPELDAFSHIHPVKVDDWKFAVTVPPLPAGTYRIYADITHESGFVQTLTDVIELGEHAPAEGATPPVGIEPDPDDSWHIGDIQQAEGTERYTFDDGATLVWNREGPIHVDEETVLSFSLLTESGAPASLEPYMGMLSHAAVRRTDGAVFIHLHPTGTISMAAQMLFKKRGEASESGEGTVEAGTGEMDHGEMDHGEMDHGEMDHSQHGMDANQVSTVTLPYEFPRDGTYRIWVQVKSAGRVYTAVFETEVLAQTPG